VTDTTASLAWPASLGELVDALGPHVEQPAGWPDELSVWVRAGVLREVVAEAKEAERLRVAMRALAGALESDSSEFDSEGDLDAADYAEFVAGKIRAALEVKP
jgi:hypothetical protein